MALLGTENSAMSAIELHPESVADTKTNYQLIPDFRKRIVGGWVIRSHTKSARKLAVRDSRIACPLAYF
jgi:hypothetical protein